MASRLILDRKDPGIEEMVAAWQNGEEYDFGAIHARQVATNKNQVEFDVISISEGGEVVLDDEGPPAKPPPTPKQAIPISYRK